MIGSLRGKLLDRDHSGSVVIEVDGTGLGYRTVMGPAAAAGLGDIGAEVFVWVHHHIREDSQCLYGFAEPAERRTFEVLLGAHGVGPALALAILSVHGPQDLVRVVAEEDVAGLCLVPGVGKKTAARLLLELKSRLETDDVGVPVNPTTGSPTPGGIAADVHAALEGLGYRGDEISDVLRTEAVREAADAESALRGALRQLGARR